MTNKISRRDFGRSAAAIAGLAALPTRALAAGNTIKIGFVTPQTGPLAVFAESDAFVLDQFRTALADGLEIAGKTYNIEIIIKDSQSSSNRASSVAQELILDDEVHLILATS